MVRIAKETPRFVEKTLHLPAGLTELEAKKYSQIPAAVRYVADSSFDSGDTEQRLFGQPSLIPRRPVWTEFPEAVDDLSQEPQRRTLSAQEEQRLFLQFNYAKYRLAELVASQLRRASLLRAREMLLWHQRACDAREHLVESNMALVITMGRKVYFTNLEFSDLVSEGNVALFRCVEKFDVSKGYRFSTYACNSILRIMGRLASRSAKHRMRPEEYEGELDQVNLGDFKEDREMADQVDSLREVLAGNHAHLTTLERRVLTERFALVSRNQRRTLSEISGLVGLSSERVRQIQNRAIEKLRETLSN